MNDGVINEFVRDRSDDLDDVVKHCESDLQATDIRVLHKGFQLPILQWLLSVNKRRFAPSTTKPVAGETALMILKCA